MAPTLKQLQEIQNRVQPTVGQGLTLGIDGKVPFSVIPNEICVVRRATDFTLTDSAWNLVTWDADTYDPYNMHSLTTNTGRITVKTDGLYLCGFNIFFTCSTTQISISGAQMQVNTSAVPGATTTAVAYSGKGALTRGGITIGEGAFNYVHLAANDYVALVAYEDGVGGKIPTNPYCNQMYVVRVA